MLAIAMASLFISASDPVVTHVGSLKDQPVRYCRPIVSGVSRSGDVNICRTKEEWWRYDSCHGATRYCGPTQKATLGKQTAFALTEDSRIVCRMLKVTGSRLSSQRTCLPNREWQRMWDNGRETMGSLQDHQSKIRVGGQ